MNRGLHKEYLLTIHLYWLLKKLLGKVLFEHNDSEDELVLHMEESHLFYQIMDERMQCMEVILPHNLPPPVDLDPLA